MPADLLPSRSACPKPEACCAHEQEIVADGKNVVPDVWDVLDKIKSFSDKVWLQACPWLAPVLTNSDLLTA